jgi:MFS family permease
MPLNQTLPRYLRNGTLQGIGFGGEWSVGAILIAEMILPEHRGKAVGLVQSGWAVRWSLAAIAYAAAYTALKPDFAWRLLFGLGCYRPYS